LPQDMTHQLCKATCTRCQSWHLLDTVRKVKRSLTLQNQNILRPFNTTRTEQAVSCRPPTAVALFRSRQVCVGFVVFEVVDCVWNVMARGDARAEKWRGNKRMEWVTSKRHMTGEHRLARTVQTLQATVDSSSSSSRLNWPPCRFKWTRPFRRKTKSGFRACAITFQT
jgi:hypothetical protein